MSSTVPVTATVLSKTEAWLGIEFNSKLTLTSDLMHPAGTRCKYHGKELDSLGNFVLMLTLCENRIWAGE